MIRWGINFTWGSNQYTVSAAEVVDQEIHLMPTNWGGGNQVVPCTGITGIRFVFLDTKNGRGGTAATGGVDPLTIPESKHRRRTGDPLILLRSAIEDETKLLYERIESQHGRAHLLRLYGYMHSLNYRVATCRQEFDTLTKAQLKKLKEDAG